MAAAARTLDTVPRMVRLVMLRLAAEISNAPLECGVFSLAGLEFDGVIQRDHRGFGRIDEAETCCAIGAPDHPRAQRSAARRHCKIEFVRNHRGGFKRNEGAGRRDIPNMTVNGRTAPVECDDTSQKNAEARFFPS